MYKGGMAESSFPIRSTKSAVSGSMAFESKSFESIMDVLDMQLFELGVVRQSPESFPDSKLGEKRIEHKTKRRSLP